MLPPDNHVHAQWSWDADAGSMEASCERAVELGLPSIAFTDHMLQALARSGRALEVNTIVPLRLLASPAMSRASPRPREP